MSSYFSAAIIYVFRYVSFPKLDQSLFLNGASNIQIFMILGLRNVVALSLTKRNLKIFFLNFLFLKIVFNNSVSLVSHKEKFCICRIFFLRDLKFSFRIPLRSFSSFGINSWYYLIFRISPSYLLLHHVSDQFFSIGT